MVVVRAEFLFRSLMYGFEPVLALSIRSSNLAASDPRWGVARKNMHCSRSASAFALSSSRASKYASNLLAAALVRGLFDTHLFDDETTHGMSDE